MTSSSRTSSPAARPTPVRLHPPPYRQCPHRAGRLHRGEYAGGCRTQPTVSPENNDGTCYPVRWSPDGEVETPKIAWFNKYVVDTVTETDRISRVSDTMVTKYTYTNPAWGKETTSSPIRPCVPTVCGVATSRWHGRGEQEQRRVSGCHPVPVLLDRPLLPRRGRCGQGFQGEETLLADDAPQYAGMVAETISYAGTDGPVVKRTLNYPWSKQTASRTRDRQRHLAPLCPPDRRPAYGRDPEGRRQLAGGTHRDRGRPRPRPSRPGADIRGQAVRRRRDLPRDAAPGPSTRTTRRRAHRPAQAGQYEATSCAAYDSADPATQLISATRTSYDGPRLRRRAGQGPRTSHHPPRRLRLLRRHHHHVRPAGPHPHASPSRARAGPRRSTPPLPVAR